MCQGSIQYYIDLHCPIMSHLVKGSHVQPDLSIRTGPLGKVSKCRLLELHLFCSFVVTRLPCGKCNRKKDVGKKNTLSLYHGTSLKCLKCCWKTLHALKTDQTFDRERPFVKPIKSEKMLRLFFVRLYMFIPTQVRSMLWCYVCNIIYIICISIIVNLWLWSTSAGRREVTPAALDLIVIIFFGFPSGTSRPWSDTQLCVKLAVPPFFLLHL